MPRSRNKVASRNRRRRMMKHAKGYWGLRSHVWTVAKNHIEKGWTHAYRDRRLKKRQYRRLWIVRINAAARLNGTTYSRLIGALNTKGLDINRKVLANIAMHNPEAFTAIVKHVQAGGSVFAAAGRADEDLLEADVHVGMKERTDTIHIGDARDVTLRILRDHFGQRLNLLATMAKHLADTIQNNARHS